MTSKLLIAWNGMISPQVSGGDMYIKKLIDGIDLSAISCTLISAGVASDLIDKEHSKLISKHLTIDRKTAGSLLSMVFIYFARTIKAALYGFRLKRLHIDTALASSPFIYDILPVILSGSRRNAVILFHLIPERKAHSLTALMRFKLATIEQRFSLAIINRYFDVILVGNEDLRQELLRKFPTKQIVVAHAGINTQSMDTYARQPKKDKNLGVFVGRLTQQKGVIDLVYLAEAMSHKRPDFRLVLIGEGPDRKKLETMISQKKLKNIVLRGFVSDQEKYDLMSRANFFIFPSYEEGWGIALAEALYMKCLVVCYELMHYRSLFEDFPIYVAKGNEDALAEAVDKNYSQNPSENQQEFVRRYDDVTVVRSILKDIGL